MSTLACLTEGHGFRILTLLTEGHARI
jgi:hypothetical protein